MQNIIEIKRLSREDKIKIMEVIWEDLSREPEEVESPDWHQKALQDTECRPTFWSVFYRWQCGGLCSSGSWAIE